MVVVGGASGTALYVTRRRMQRKLELFEQRVAVEKERGRIAKDIHDDLGSSLTRIMMLGERAEEDLGKREEPRGARRQDRRPPPGGRCRLWTKSCGR